MWLNGSLGLFHSLTSKARFDYSGVNMSGQGEESLQRAGVISFFST